MTLNSPNKGKHVMCLLLTFRVQPVIPTLINNVMTKPRCYAFYYPTNIARTLIILPTYKQKKSNSFLVKTEKNMITKLENCKTISI